MITHWSHQPSCVCPYVTTSYWFGPHYSSYDQCVMLFSSVQVVPLSRTYHNGSSNMIIVMEKSWHTNQSWCGLGSSTKTLGKSHSCKSNMLHSLGTEWYKTYNGTPPLCWWNVNKSRWYAQSLTPLSTLLYIEGSTLPPRRGVVHCGGVNK